MKPRATAKRFKCAECGFVYVSPLPVAEVQHDCKRLPPAGTKRKGMLPE